MMNPIDPVCGMEISPPRNIEATWKDKQYYFCSLDCLEEFQASPDDYLGDEEVLA